MTDKELLDWLDDEAFGIALIHDDNQCWAVSGIGFQNVPENPPDDMETTFFIEKSEWKSTAREALECAYKECHKEE